MDLNRKKMKKETQKKKKMSYPTDSILKSGKIPKSTTTLTSPLLSSPLFSLGCEGKLNSKIIFKIHIEGSFSFAPQISEDFISRG